MFGELDTSHVGITTPASSKAVAGHLGVRFVRSDYDEGGRLRVGEVFALSPAAIAGITVGDYLLAIDGRPITPQTNLDELLQQKIGKRVTVKISGNAVGMFARDVALAPVDGATERGLAYRAWVDARRKYVDRASKGKLGYVHLSDMSESALSRLYADLDSDNQTRAGVIVDVRYNRGGFVNGYAIDVFARKNYLTMTRRGFGPVPGRVRLGQRALDAPTVLVTNRNTYSDGEDFTQAFRALKLGKVVGEPTAGCVVFTSIVPLLDGTRMGLPTTKVIDSEGQSLEGHPRPVDVKVDRTPGEAYIGKDAQLDAAVEALLPATAKGEE
jgi:C-terminal processing protease CtpA/Prc